ncbi:dTDP-4-dehydrorhamnose reductase [Lysobacter yangpyeongensis]|uniref:dTDP-4-dehydrorhamnose reductase n=1 Tax=Lysobacter yangpyeongensis TaxID=346182 RepID=A0ABW0SL12_9GAMM
MRILLLGANGQVGHELRRSLAPLGEVVATTRTGLLADGGQCEALDVGAPETFATLFDRVAPDVVVNATAYTSVDRAEAEPELAWRINAEAPAELARHCAARGARLVHYSTDYVFDGNSSVPYREDDPACPINVYGASKLEGERRIQACGASSLILRIAWVYATRGHNFLRTMLGLARDHDEVRVVADHCGCPTPAWLVADVTARILSLGDAASGLQHLVAGGATSWHGFAERIFAIARAQGLVEHVPRVVPIAAKDYPARARRPHYSVLDTARLRTTYDLSLPGWDDALATTLQHARAAAGRDASRRGC